MSFLVCSEYPASLAPALPDSFIINGLGIPDPTTGLIAPVTTPADILPDGGVELHYDLSKVANGSYTVTVEASLSGNASAGSASFTFTLPVTPPVVPAVPTGLAISAT
jgi:hypothetical protein